ncbi:restriction endonuclease subunit S [Virgibacillus indicus]|uniref:restriction endonuclease subunit S n=1 Tax=Virgibacillus indicus TaxID=2024554 RepID=UPI000D52577D|nr:restriction endonuclease subunit S [Virgibacillus indicus]
MKAYLLYRHNCVFSDSVKRLKLKERKGNSYIYLFLKTMILQQKQKYHYGYKFNTQRMNRQKILLPVNQNPNYS